MHALDAEYCISADSTLLCIVLAVSIAVPFNHESILLVSRNDDLLFDKQKHRKGIVSNLTERIKIWKPELNSILAS